MPPGDRATAIGNTALDIGSPTVGDVYVITIANTKTGEAAAEERK
jgi:hypothetical protein